MTQANPQVDSVQAERKAAAIELLRDLVSTLAALADILDKSQSCSADLLTMQLQGAQALCASWQHRASERVRAWNIEDFEQRRALEASL